MGLWRSFTNRVATVARIVSGKSTSSSSSSTTTSTPATSSGSTTTSSSGGSSGGGSTTTSSSSGGGSSRSSGSSGGGSSKSVLIPAGTISNQKISSSKAAQYRAEEKATYKRLGYTGGTNYNVSVSTSSDGSRKLAVSNVERIPTTSQERAKQTIAQQNKLEASKTLITNKDTQKRNTFYKLTPEEKAENRKVILEKDWIVRGKSGRWSAFGTGARAFGKVGAYTSPFFNKVINKTPLKELNKVMIRSDVAEGFTADVGKWIFFSQAMVTTAGYYKAVQPTEVLYGGTTQRIGTNKINTNIVYKTSTGKRGIARGTTAIKRAGKNTYISGTRSIGSEYSVVYNAPKGKFVAMSNKVYAGAEASVTKTAGRRFEQVGIGKIFTKKGSTKFLSGAKGFKIGKVTGSRGTVITKDGQVFSGGLTHSIKSTSPNMILTNIPKSSVAGFSNVPSGVSTVVKTSPALSKSIAEASTKQIVSSVYATTPSRVTTIAPIVGIVYGQVSKQTSKPIQVYTPSASRSIIAKPIIATEIYTSPKIREETITTVITKSKPSSHLASGNIPKVITTTIPAITPAIKIKTVPSMKTPSLSTLSPSAPPINSFPNIPFIPPFALGFAGGKKGYGRVKTKAKYGYTPSYTALAFGIVGKKKAPTIGKRYTGLEFRPITKQWASQFNRGTRKLRNKKAIKLFM